MIRRLSGSSGASHREERGDTGHGTWEGGDKKQTCRISMQQTARRRVLLVKLRYYRETNPGPLVRSITRMSFTACQRIHSPPACLLACLPRLDWLLRGVASPSRHVGFFVVGLGAMAASSHPRCHWVMSAVGALLVVACGRWNREHVNCLQHMIGRSYCYRRSG